MFPDTTKVAYFQCKNADVSNAQEVCFVIYIFFVSSLGITAKRNILTDFRQWSLYPPPFVSSPEKAHPD